MAAPFINAYVACVVDYPLANNQIAKALIVLSMFTCICSLTTVLLRNSLRTVAGNVCGTHK